MSATALVSKKSGKRESSEPSLTQVLFMDMRQIYVPTTLFYNKAIQPECPYRETDAVFPSGGKRGGRRREGQPYYAKEL